MQERKNIAGKIFLSLVFFRNVFLSGEIDWFFRKSAKKNTMFFSGNARPKSNVRTHLKQRKKHSGLTFYLREHYFLISP